MRVMRTPKAQLAGLLGIVVLTTTGAAAVPHEQQVALVMESLVNTLDGSELRGYRQSSTDEQRRGAGCIGGRMRPYL